MKSRTKIVFKRKELKDILDQVKNYSHSDQEQSRIQFGIDLLEWVLKDDIIPNKLIRDEK